MTELKPLGDPSAVVCDGDVCIVPQPVHDEAPGATPGR